MVGLFNQRSGIKRGSVTRYSSAATMIIISSVYCWKQNKIQSSRSMDGRLLILDTFDSQSFGHKWPVLPC